MTHFRPKFHQAFSLTELLIALGVLALLTALIAPKFFNIQQQAKDIVAKNMAADLNNTYGDWLNAGGQVSNSATPYASDALLAMNATDSGAFTNGGSSSKFQFPVPASANLSTSNQQPVVDLNGVAVAYDTATNKFIAAALPADGTPVQVGSYIAAVDPSTGAFSFAGMPAMGSVATLGSSLVMVDPNTGALVTTPASSANAPAPPEGDSYAFEPQPMFMMAQPPGGTPFTYIPTPVYGEVNGTLKETGINGNNGMAPEMFMFSTNGDYLFMDGNGNYVDSKGNYYDGDGNPINYYWNGSSFENSSGTTYNYDAYYNLVDSNGNYVDINGNPTPYHWDANGDYVDANGNPVAPPY